MNPPLFCAYLAALFDGDGSPMWCGYRRGQRRGYPALSLLVNTSRAAMELTQGLEQQFGGRSRVNRNRYQQTWRAERETAVRALLAIAPFSLIKSRKIELVVRLATLQKMGAMPTRMKTLDMLRKNGPKRRVLSPRQFTEASLELDALGAPSFYDCPAEWGLPPMSNVHLAGVMPVLAAGFFDAEGHITITRDHSHWKWIVGWSQNASTTAWPLMARLKAWSGGTLKERTEVFSPGIRTSLKGTVGAAGQGCGESLATSITAARRGSRHVALGTSAGTCA
ncbi:hypothetical protein [Geodermatophilus sp. URMC 62]|uniref:hypothetical protein n=1 Tax=Geodermatophilus sp. URMC 62 TaxID=3423414 RepID=UPI00406C2BE8